MIVCATVAFGSPPLPSSPRLQRVMMHMLKGHLTGIARGTIVDLGSGWGGLARQLAKRFPRHQIVGYERSTLPWLVSRIWLLMVPQANLQFRHADFMKSDVSDVTLAVCYLMPGIMVKLADKLLRELPPGALVLSNTFALPGWQPIDQRVGPDLFASRVYLYAVPAQLAERSIAEVRSHGPTRQTFQHPERDLFVCEPVDDSR